MDHRDEDLDRLASELNAAALPALPDVTTREASATLSGWLRRVREAGGSDLLLVAGAPPTVRVTGRLHPVSGDVLDSQDIEASVAGILSPALRSRFHAGQAVDLAFNVPDLGRFRMNLHRERGRVAAAIRALPTSIPQLSELGFSRNLAFLAALPRGLVLIGGPTGSGKTTTLAALVAEINRDQARHIISIEDPIEYEHPHGRSLIEQIEIGIDAPDFPTALRAAVRQAPDVLVVGEMRDPETMQMALSAAETGHLVFATVHTTDVSAAVSRVVDAFPTERQNAARQALAMGVAAILTQTLLPSTKGGLVPAAELLVVSYGARQHIRKNALQHLQQEITIMRKAGSFTLEESLASLVRSGLLERQDALMKAGHPDELASILGSGNDSRHKA